MEFYDQSKHLKQYTQKKQKISENEKLAKLISITSGKGGVGKTNFILNLAISMSIRNKKVLLIDADMNLSNIDILLGLYPEYTIANLLDNLIDIDKLLIEGPKGVKILPAASGDYKVMERTEEFQKGLIQVYKELRDQYDYILIDTGAGISNHTIDFVVSSEKIIIITTPEPTAITDAYAMIKILNYRMKDPDISLLINMVQSEDEGKNIYNKINLIVQHFLNKEVHYLGCIKTDPFLIEAVKEQVPIIIKRPRSVSSIAFHNIAMYFLKEDKNVL